MASLTPPQPAVCTTTVRASVNEKRLLRRAHQGDVRQDLPIDFAELHWGRNLPH